MLFDLEDDPKELNNLYRKKSVVSGYFRQLVKKEFDYKMWLSQKKKQKEAAIRKGPEKQPKKNREKEHKALIKKLKALGYVE